ncbi:MAG: hypothetical protein RL681_233 [Candidatus Parcubacteria bacterium]|jgi:prophage maintenance system killer protein
MKKTKRDIVVYQAPSGAIELRGDIRRETIWATQAQIALAFDVDVRTVNEHLKNIYRTAELEEKPTIRKFRIVQKEGNRTISRDIAHYDLDAIISVGYRVNSQRATRFRQWATKTLRAHIVEGYTINRKRIGQNYDAFLKAMDDVRALLPSGGKMDAQSVLDLIRAFADTWVSLNAYDKGIFPGKTTKRKVAVTADALLEDIARLKADLMKRGEASELFAAERNRETLAGIVGNVFQSFGGKELYPSVEAKAAHLLYFVVKGHPFTDGNKRSGAFAFVWFLRRAGVLNKARLTPEALTALTLLIAESDPKDKERMLGLVTMLLGKVNKQR